ncbi:hypothetical protein [Vibrio phage CAU_VPP01]|nr:hypothetical protein [Vibrio phage CAU_VPP01]
MNYDERLDHCNAYPVKFVVSIPNDAPMLTKEAITQTLLANTNRDTKQSRDPTLYTGLFEYFDMAGLAADFNDHLNECPLIKDVGFSTMVLTITVRISNPVGASDDACFMALERECNNLAQQMHLSGLQHVQRNAPTGSIYHVPLITVALGGDSLTKPVLTKDAQHTPYLNLEIVSHEKI